MYRQKAEGKIGEIVSGSAGLILLQIALCLCGNVTV